MILGWFMMIPYASHRSFRLRTVPSCDTGPSTLAHELRVLGLPPTAFQGQTCHLWPVEPVEPIEDLEKCWRNAEEVRNAVQNLGTSGNFVLVELQVAFAGYQVACVVVESFLRCSDGALGIDSSGQKTMMAPSKEPRGVIWYWKWFRESEKCRLRFSAGKYTRAQNWTCSFLCIYICIISARACLHPHFLALQLPYALLVICSLWMGCTLSDWV